MATDMTENLPIGIPLQDKFKLLRKLEGLSQQAFCDLIGVSQSTIANVEKGRNKTIGVNILTKICDQLFSSSMGLCAPSALMKIVLWSKV